MSIATRVIPSLQRTILIVAAMHLVILIGSMWQIKYTSQKAPSTRLVVHTIVPSPAPVSQEVSPLSQPSLSPPPPSSLPSSPPSTSVQEISPQKMSSTQEQEVTQPKNQAKEPIRKVIQQEPKRPETPVKKEKTKKETKVEVKKEKTEKIAKTEKKEDGDRRSVEKKAPSLDKKILKELQQELQEAKTLDAHAPVDAHTTPHLSLPQLSKTAEITGVSGSGTTSSLNTQTEENYISQLKQHLQDTLRLPDIGEITIGLRLTPQGKVVHMEILKKTSVLNERYVLDQIPQISFPAWDNGVEEKYFPITLRSK